VALESLNSSLSIRQAARYSLSRLLGAMGTRVFPQIPRWIEGLLSQSSSKDEMSYFLRLLGQTIFAFKADVSPILDAVLSPLLQRVFERLSDPVTGTDDEMSLTALRREFLSFVLTCLNHDLGPVFISSSELQLGIISLDPQLTISRQSRHFREHHHSHRTFCS
jgi:exportin-T